jgi:type II secretory pathway component GspD/PulD (secretin)
MTGGGLSMRATLLTFALLFAAAAAVGQPPPGVPRTVNVIALKNADAEKLRPIVETIFGRQGVTAVADSRTNSLVVAADADTLKEVAKLVTELNKPAKRQ